jgi:hypothetical protein
MLVTSHKDLDRRQRKKGGAKQFETSISKLLFPDSGPRCLLPHAMLADDSQLRLVFVTTRTIAPIKSHQAWWSSGN